MDATGPDLIGLALGFVLSGFCALFMIRMGQQRGRVQRRRALLAMESVHYLAIERREDGSERWTCDRCDYDSELTGEGLIAHNEGNRRAWHTCQGSMFDPRMEPAMDWAKVHMNLISTLDDAYRQPD